VYERDRRWERYAPKPRPQLRETNDVELAWLAGLLEGEGAFVVQHVKADARQAARVRVRVSLQMTDQDVVERVRTVVGLGKVGTYHPHSERHKDTYVWGISSKGVVVPLLQLLRPHMGQRRRTQIDACLAAVEAAGGIPQRKRRHGQTKYQLDGCRCDVCYQAKSLANSRRDRRREPADVV
jgi:hypothetical protein